MQNSISGLLVQPPADILTHSAERLQSRVRALEGASSAEKKAQLKKVAEEFESLFVAYLLKTMRETIEESGFTEGGLGKGIYTDLFDQELSRSIAGHGALGIADLLMKRFEEGVPAQAPIDGADASPTGTLRVRPTTVPSPDLQKTDGGEGRQEEIPDFRLPLRAPVSSGFGTRQDPFTRQLRFHKGVDLAVPAGTPVAAAMGGVVLSAGFEPGYGNTVVLQHSGDLQTRYAHLATVNVKKGDIVRPEQILGPVGSTGHSTGPHLHFEVIRRGEPVDPHMALAD